MKKLHSTLVPVVEKADLERFSGPQMRLSRGKARSLADKGIITKGFTVPIRTARGVAGRRKYHSGLSLLALQAFAAGDTGTAEALGRSAAVVEEKFSPKIQKFLVNHEASELDTAPFWRGLVEATTKAFNDRSVRADLIFADGIISYADDGETYIEAKRFKDGQDMELPVPSELVRAQGLAEGDTVWVLRSLAGPNVLISLVRTMAPPVADTADDSYLTSEAGSGTLSSAQIAYLRSLDEERLPVVRIAG